MASAKLPLNLTVLTNGISVSGTAWTIDDEDELARMVGRIFLGHFLHVEKILQKLKPKHKMVDGQAAKEAKARLVVKKGTEPWHRDGLVFQSISWIAAHQASVNKSSVFSLPHMIPAHKGFDGLEIEMTSKNKLHCLVIFEDKATENPRDMIRTSVWPDIEALHGGQRQTELMQELTALLQRANVKDPDAIIETAVWKQIRKFRVSVTGAEGQDEQAEFDKLFKGFDAVTPGLDALAPRAEVFCHSDIRKWMKGFAVKISKAIDAEKAKSDV